MTPADLITELDRWTDAGLTARFWWRDDDAIDVSAPLERLTSLSQRVAAPVTLAVIPEPATPTLADHVADHPTLTASVHGWAHTNHEPSGQKASEFGMARGSGEIASDLRRGRSKIADLYGDKAALLFVPPWNRLTDQAARQVADAGFSALSGLGSPRSTCPGGLHQLNVHIDPIDWRGGRGLHRVDHLVGQIVALLVERREQGRFTDAIGFMTHHLVHDQAIWTFTETFANIIADHPSARWYSATTLLFEDQGDQSSAGHQSMP